jgi:hypothetical protein
MMKEFILFSGCAVLLLLFATVIYWFYMCSSLLFFRFFFFFWWRLCWSCIFLCILVHIHTENIKNWFVFGQHLICISSIANSVDKSVVPAFLQLNSSKSWFQNRWCIITTWLSKFVVTVLPQLDIPPPTNRFS